MAAGDFSLLLGDSFTAVTELELWRDLLQAVQVDSEGMERCSWVLKNDFVFLFGPSMILYAGTAIYLVMQTSSTRLLFRFGEWRFLIKLRLLGGDASRTQFLLKIC